MAISKVRCNSVNLFQQGISEAIRLIVQLDAQVLNAAMRSLWISITAVGIASVFGVAFGTLLARRSFPGRGLLVLAARGGMSLPTVFVGLVCFGLFSRNGILGPVELLYTPWAIVFGECLLAFPIVVSLTHGAVRALDPRVSETAKTLGAGVFLRCRTYLAEARVGVTLAILTAFSRCVTELGIAMMVGGNLKDRTRTLATATALETGKGEFGRGMAMGIILVCIAVGMTIVIVYAGRDQTESTRD